MPPENGELSESTHRFALRSAKRGLAYETRAESRRKRHAPEAGRATVGIVTIVASLGGIAAIRNLLHELSEDFPVPIVIAQHLHPGSPLILASFSASRTSPAAHCLSKYPWAPAPNAACNNDGPFVA